MYNSQQIAERIKKTSKIRGVTLSNMLTECNLGINLISQISKGSIPKSDTLAKIADYLDCSVDYLLGRTPQQNVCADNNSGTIGVVGSANAPVTIKNGNERPLTNQEQDLLRIYNLADGKNQMKIMNFIYEIEENLN